MTIKDRDVIKQLDNYLNPDAVGLIDSYLEKNVHVEPILPNLTEGGCSHVPDAFFKEFDIITKGDMRSTLFDTDFIDNEMALLKAFGLKEGAAKLGSILGRGQGLGRGGGSFMGQTKRKTLMQRVSNAASKASEKVKGAKESTGKGWGTVKDNSWFAPWSAAWRGQIGAELKEGKKAFHEQRRLEQKANEPIKSKMYENSPRAYATERGRLATRYANAHADAEKSMKGSKRGILRQDFATNAMEKLSETLGVDPASGEELHTLKEMDTRTRSTTTGVATKRGQEIRHVWGEDKAQDDKLVEAGQQRQKDGRVEVAVNEDTFGTLIDNAKGERRNELLEKHEGSITGKGEGLSDAERNELEDINSGMNIRESAEAAGTDLDMVEYHVNQIKRAGNPGLLDGDARLKEVIPPDTSIGDWPDSFGGADTAKSVSDNFDTNVGPKMAGWEEAAGEGGVMNFEDAKLSSHVDHMRGRELSSPGAKTESQLASDIRTGTGVSGMGTAAAGGQGVPKADREYLKAGQSAPKWGGNQVQEITSPDGARYYSKKQSRQLREQHQESKKEEKRHRKETTTKERKGKVSRGRATQERQKKRKETREKITADVKGKLEDVIDALSSQSKPTSVATKKAEQAEKEEEKAKKDEPKIAKKAEKEADKRQKEADKRDKEEAQQAEDQRKEVERRAAERQEEQKRFDNLSQEAKEEELLGAINQVLEDAKGPEQGKLWQFMNRLLGGEGQQAVQKALDGFFSLRKSKNEVTVGIDLTFFLDTFMLGMEYGLEVEEASDFALDMVSKSNSELNDYLDRTNISGDLFIKANLNSYKKDPVDELQGMIDAIVLLDAVSKVESK